MDEPNEDSKRDEKMILSSSALMAGTSPMDTLQPCTESEGNGDRNCRQPSDGGFKIAIRNDSKFESESEGQTAQAEISNGETVEQCQEPESQGKAINQTIENSVTASEDVATLASEPSLGRQSIADEVSIHYPSATSALETTQQTIIAQGQESQVLLCAAITELEVEQQRWEEALKREQQEREVRDAHRTMVQICTCANMG